MPMIISTPEAWFRTKGCDFFEFRPTEVDAGFFSQRAKKLPSLLTDWLSATFAHRRLQRLGPSEYSGYICGGPSMDVIEMSPEEVDIYSAQWEDATGKCNDDRWQCYQLPYEVWLEKFSRIEVSLGRPPEGTPCRWLLCNAGLFTITGSYTAEGVQNNSCPGQPCADDWWLMRQRFPGYVIADDEVFFMGCIFAGQDDEPRVIFESYRQEGGDLTYAPIFHEETGDSAIARVREALALPESAKVTSGLF